MNDKVDPVSLRVNRDFDAVMSRELTDDPVRAEVIFSAQIEDCFDDLGWRLVGRVLWNWLLVARPAYVVLLA
jgi:hypothetical protein